MTTWTGSTAGVSPALTIERTPVLPADAGRVGLAGLSSVISMIIDISAAG
jgi:hypothetical protein